MRTETNQVRLMQAYPIPWDWVLDLDSVLLLSLCGALITCPPDRIARAPTLPLRVGVEQVAEALHVPVLLPRLP
jgi:hypothetical protein